MDKNTIATKYWHKLDDGRVQCDLCPRYCKLKQGQRGLCFVRANEDDQIVLTTYGRSSGFCVDPIEKKPLNHFLPGTPVLSFGTAGCNLACKFCQNWDISKSREIDTLADEASPEKIAEVAAKLNCRSVAYTYNDPVIFHEYAIDVAAECRKRDIKNVAVTAGYICPEPAKEFFAFMDAANVDLKAFTDDFYHKLTGGHLLKDRLALLRRHPRLFLSDLIAQSTDHFRQTRSRCRVRHAQLILQPGQLALAADERLDEGQLLRGELVEATQTKLALQRGITAAAM